MRRASCPLASRARRGSMLIDVVVAIVIFVGALTTFMTLARDNSRLIDDVASRTAALALARTHLADMARLDMEAAMKLDGRRTAIADFSAGKGAIRIGVAPGPFAETWRVDVTAEWLGSDGHWRQLTLSSHRGRWDRLAQEQAR